MSVNLIELLSSQMSGSVLSQASSFLGESESSTKTAMGAALPAILGSIIQKGSDKSGAQGIMDMISSNGIDGSMLSNMASMFGGGDSTNNMMSMGSGMLNSLMGNKMSGVTDLISKISGIGSGSSSSLMNMLAPMVMGGIAKQVMGKGASGLMSFLSSQADHVKAAAPAGMSSLMGLGNLGNMGDMANKTMGSVKSMTSNAASTTTAAVAETAEAGGSMFRKLLPIGVIALLAFGAFYMFKGGSVADAASNMTDKVTDAAGDVANAAGDAAGAAADAATGMADAAVDAAGNAVDATGNALKSMADYTKDAAGNLVDATGNVVHKAGEFTVDAAGNVVDAAGNAANAAGEMAANAAAYAKKALEGVTFAAGSAGEKFTTYLASGTTKENASFAFNNLNFDVGSSTIASNSLSEVDNFAKAMMAYPSVHVEVGGHTDNSGDAAKNLKLSSERAAAVKARLMEKGVDAARITAKGYGATAPIADNSTAEGRKANRRTEIKITK